MKLAILMDEVSQLVPYKDTTVGMILSAKKMGWECFCFTSSNMFCREGHVYAQMHNITIGDIHQSNWAELTDVGEQSLTDFDIILMRKDPPFDMEYIYCTYALELVERAGVLVANKPQSLRDANEKYFALNFPQCTPTTLISNNMTKLAAFWQEYPNIIFKPLDGMGGSSIFHVDEHAKNLSVILETLTQRGQVSIMAQHYIPDIVNKGDKRILLIDGEPVPYGLARIPAAGELRGNLAAGATGVVTAITERDRWICQQVGPTLKAKGLYFVGIDVIGDYLTEINVTSPTCAREIMAETGIDITGNYLRCLEQKVARISAA